MLLKGGWWRGVVHHACALADDIHGGGLKRGGRLSSKLKICTPR